MFVIYIRDINGTSIPFMYKSIENAIQKLMETKVETQKERKTEFITKNIGYINGHGPIYSLSIKNDLDAEEADPEDSSFSAFNNDPIMYNGPHGLYPDELHLMKIEDEDEDEEA